MSGEASCTTAQTPSEETQNYTTGLGKYASDYYHASKFVYTGTTDKGICAIDIWGAEVGDVAARTVDIAIRGDDSGEDDPDDTIYSYTATLGAAALFPAVGDWVGYQDMTVNTNLTNGNTYWIVAHMSTVNSTNYVQLGADSSCTTEVVVRDADGTGEWSALHTDRCLMFKIRSQ